MKVGIVIVCFNGLKYLPALLTSLDKYSKAHHIYLVDNASTDQSINYVSRLWPKVVLIPQVVNLGFAAGNNVGIKRALADGVGAVWLLNQDAEVMPGCLEKLISNLQNEQSVGALSPRLSLPDGRINSLGNVYHYLGFGYAGGNGLSFEEALRQLPWIKKSQEPPYLSGAAMLISAKALQEVGLLDEELFMYHEDLELCWRLRQVGYKLKVVPESEIIHYYTFASSTKQYYYMERNRMLVWFGYFKWPTIILLFIPQLISELAIIFTAVVNGWLGEHFRAIRFWLSPAGREYIIKKRQEIKRLRKKSDRYLLSFASGVIQFQEKNPWYVKFVFNPVSALLWVIIKQFIWW